MKPRFCDAAKTATQKGLQARDALRVSLARDARSFPLYARDSRLSARDTLKAWRDSTGAFQTGETEAMEGRGHKPLNEYCCEKCREKDLA